MGFADRVTRKARERLEGQVAPGEQVVLSSNLAASALVLTGKRLMIAPALAGAEPDINVPLSQVHNVSWQKGLLGSPGTLTVHTGSETHQYKVRNNQGEQTATVIRQTMATA